MPTISSVAADRRWSSTWAPLAQAAHVFILNMATVLAQMHGDTVRTAQLEFPAAAHTGSVQGAAGLPQGGYMVDIDAEFDHSSCNSMKILRVASGLPPR